MTRTLAHSPAAERWAWLDKYGLDRRRIPDIAWTYKGLLVIAAGAACVWDDLERFGCRSKVRNGSVHVPDGHLMCINSIGMDMPGEVVHWYSNDATLLEAWSKARRPEHVIHWDKNLSRWPIKYHSYSEKWGTYWPVQGHGTSLLNGIFVGLLLGYEPIVICGGPLDDTPHYHDPPWRRTNFTREHNPKKWQTAYDRVLKGRVFSMSGNSRELLGAPPGVRA